MGEDALHDPAAKLTAAPVPVAVAQLVKQLGLKLGGNADHRRVKTAGHVVLDCLAFLSQVSVVVTHFNSSQAANVSGYARRTSLSMAEATC